MEEVQASIDAVASLVASGMDWSDVDKVVKEEQKKGNPIAEIIFELSLEQVCFGSSSVQILSLEGNHFVESNVAIAVA